jgi:hypothetical protein
VDGQLSHSPHSLVRSFLLYFVAVVSLWKLWNRRFHSFHSTSSLDFMNRVNGAHAPDVFWLF